jgi:hypothetical protein
MQTVAVVTVALKKWQSVAVNEKMRIFGKILINCVKSGFTVFWLTNTKKLTHIKPRTHEETFTITGSNRHDAVHGQGPGVA